MGVAVGDYDADGFDDLYVTNVLAVTRDGWRARIAVHEDGTFALAGLPPESVWRLVVNASTREEHYRAAVIATAGDVDVDLRLEP